MAPDDHAVEQEYLIDGHLLSPLQNKWGGLHCRKTKRLSDKADEFFEWGTKVFGVDEGDGWLRIDVGGELRFLPLSVGHVPVVFSEHGAEYVVDNSVLQHESQGLHYRSSKNLKHRSGLLQPWDTTVFGYDEGDGWLNVGDNGFLPIFINNVQVLNPVFPEDDVDSLASSPSRASSPQISQNAQRTARGDVVEATVDSVNVERAEPAREPANNHVQSNPHTLISPRCSHAAADESSDTVYVTPLLDSSVRRRTSVSSIPCANDQTYFRDTPYVNHNDDVRPSRVIAVGRLGQFVEISDACGQSDAADQVLPTCSRQIVGTSPTHADSLAMHTKSDGVDNYTAQIMPTDGSCPEKAEQGESESMPSHAPPGRLDALESIATHTGSPFDEPLEQVPREGSAFACIENYATSDGQFLTEPLCSSATTATHAVASEEFDASHGSDGSSRPHDRVCSQSPARRQYSGNDAVDHSSRYLVDSSLCARGPENTGIDDEPRTRSAFCGIPTDAADARSYRVFEPSVEDCREQRALQCRELGAFEIIPSDLSETDADAAPGSVTRNGWGDVDGPGRLHATPEVLPWVVIQDEGITAPPPLENSDGMEPGAVDLVSQERGPTQCKYDNSKALVKTRIHPNITRSDTQTYTQGADMPSDLIVGTFNWCGDCYNPFEVLCTSDVTLHQEQMLVQTHFKGLSWQGLEPYAGAVIDFPCVNASIDQALNQLRSHCESGSPVWTYFSKQMHDLDDTQLGDRTNLLTLAYKLVMSSDRNTEVDRFQYELAGMLPDAPWVKAMREQASAESGAYQKRPDIFLFDLLCNAVSSASGCIQAYRNVCRRSPFSANQSRGRGMCLVNALLQRNERGLAEVVGLQGLPKEHTAGAEQVKQTLESHGYSLLRGGLNVGLAIRGFCDTTKPTFLTSHARDCSVNHGEPSCASTAHPLSGRTFIHESHYLLFPEAIMNMCIQEERERGTLISEEKRTRYVQQTAKNTFVVRLRNTVFMVLDAGQPADRTDVRILVSYIRAALHNSSSAGAWPTSWVVLADTHIKSCTLAKEFESAFMSVHDAPPASVQPAPDVITTATRRSVVHGQCYNSQIAGVVTCASDRIVAPATALLKDCRVLPNLNDGVLFPTSEWLSSHALVTATYCPPSHVGVPAPRFEAEVSVATCPFEDCGQRVRSNELLAHKFHCIIRRGRLVYNVLDSGEHAYAGEGRPTMEDIRVEGFKLLEDGEGFFHDVADLQKAVGLQLTITLPSKIIAREGDGLASDGDAIAATVKEFLLTAEDVAADKFSVHTSSESASSAIAFALGLPAIPVGGLALHTGDTTQEATASETLPPATPKDKLADPGASSVIGVPEPPQELAPDIEPRASVISNVVRDQDRRPSHGRVSLSETSSPARRGSRTSFIRDVDSDDELPFNQRSDPASESPTSSRQAHRRSILRDIDPDEKASPNFGQSAASGLPHSSRRGHRVSIVPPSDGESDGEHKHDRPDRTTTRELVSKIIEETSTTRDRILDITKDLVAQRRESVPKAAPQTDMFGYLDTDHNGILSLGEFSRLPGKTPKAAEKAFKALDTDKDGVLQREEFELGLAASTLIPKTGTHPKAKAKAKGTSKSPRGNATSPAHLPKAKPNPVHTPGQAPRSPGLPKAAPMSPKRAR